MELFAMCWLKQKMGICEDLWGRSLFWTRSQQVVRGRNVRYHVNFSFNFHLTAVLFSSYTCSILFLTPVLFSFFTCKTRFKMLKSFPFFLTFFIPLFLITLATLFYRLLREFLRRVNDEFEVGQGGSCIRNNLCDLLAITVHVRDKPATWLVTVM